MLIKLAGRALRSLGESSTQPMIGRICTDPHLQADQRASEILLTRCDSDLPAGYRAYLLLGSATPVAHIVPRELRDVYLLSDEFNYLAHGDVVRLDPQRSAISTLYRRNSPSNAFLVTERCDNYCVMCSQPPRDHDDSWLVDELMEVIPLVSPDTEEIGITGGEPSLLGSRLVALLARCQVFLPRTGIHLLSNGRSFANGELAKALANVRHPDLMVGIPLYADVPEVHDYVVQSRGAFEDTVRGILNLKQYGVKVEIRFVIHADTFETLPAFARFVARNLLFVDQVALMGLELMGFARTNLEALWIDPVDYQSELREAVETLDRAGLAVSIYNHQLCVLDPHLHRFARASISDWKTVYAEECDRCTLRDICGGFFASSGVRRSRGITAMTSEPHRVTDPLQDRTRLG